MEEKNGPYLAMAVLCEKVLNEKDGVLSAIRIIDKIVHTIAGKEVPDHFPGGTFILNALISFKSGERGGKFKLRFIPSTPSGEKMAEFSGPLVLEEKGKSANVIINMNLQFKEIGLYWFDLYLDDNLITRIPLHIEYQKKVIATETSAHHD